MAACTSFWWTSAVDKGLLTAQEGPFELIIWGFVPQALILCLVLIASFS